MTNAQLSAQACKGRKSRVVVTLQSAQIDAVAVFEVFAQRKCKLASAELCERENG